MSTATQNCEFCHSPAHIWFNCPKKPDGWKPDRLKGVRPPAPTKVTVKPNGVDHQFKVTPQELADNFGVILAKDAPAPTETHLKRGRGRPKSIDDMKAYKAEKARKRRAKLKAAKDAK